MFGYIIMNKGEMKFREFDVYHSYYCGLCQSLKQRYSVLGQASLSYDMTFVALLLNSLYEPEICETTCRCIVHPFEKHLTRRSPYTDYCADMNLLLTFYKCADDWEDDKKLWKHTYGKLIRKGYYKVGNTYPEKVRKIDSILREISAQEKKNNEDIDHMSGLFGEIMGEILAVNHDEWEEGLRCLGKYLGKFIYLMDAYEDIEDDIKKNRYNLLKRKYQSPDFEEEIRTILTMMMASCSREFEKLPIIDNAEILRNILYSGVWTRYEMLHAKRSGSGDNSFNEKIGLSGKDDSIDSDACDRDITGEN